MRRYRCRRRCVKIIAVESRAEATDDDIYCDYGREDPVCGPDIHPCERREHCAAVDEVGDEAEEDVNYVGDFAVFLQHDFFDG
jgi:hypothetical protein